MNSPCKLDRNLHLSSFRFREK